MSSIPKNRRILARAQQSFHFQKITGSLKLKSEYFLSLQKPSFYIKEQLAKRKLKIIICLVFFYFSNMAKTVFDLKNSKQEFLGEILFIFSC